MALNFSKEIKKSISGVFEQRDMNITFIMKPRDNSIFSRTGKTASYCKHNFSSFVNSCTDSMLTQSQLRTLGDGDVKAE